MKSYTDLEQSKKLAEILPPESADMCWIEVNYGDEAGSRHELSLATYKTVSHFRDSIFLKDHTIPCWSLSALLEILPRPSLHQDRDGKWYCNAEPNRLYFSSHYDNPVDACVDMIIKLKELKML